MMRTTIDLDTDVLLSAKRLAKKERSTAGRVISQVFRQGLIHYQNGDKEPAVDLIRKNGFLVLGPREGEVITSEHIRKLMDEEGV